MGPVGKNPDTWKKFWSTWSIRSSRNTVGFPLRSVRSLRFLQGYILKVVQPYLVIRRNLEPGLLQLYRFRFNLSNYFAIVTVIQ